MRARTLFLLLSCALGAACKPEETAGTGLAQSACVRSITELERLQATPTRCERDDECAAGSRCDPDSNHCTWDCLSDTECGPGNRCSCAGACVPVAGDGEVGSRALALHGGTCVKDLDLLRELDLSCGTLACPDGSRCDQQTSRCVFDCLADEDCSGGRVCDCEGRCSTPPAPDAGAPPTPAPRTVTMEVAPLAYRLRPERDAAIAPVTFEVVLSAPSAPTAPLDLRVVPSEVRAAIPDAGAGDGCVPPRVRCGATGAFSADCHLAGPFAFAPDGAGQHVARASFQVQPEPTSAPRVCGLEVRSNETTNPVATASIELLPRDAVPVDGYYRGTIALEEEGATGSSSYPVQGVLLAGRLALVDVGRFVTDHPALVVAPPYAPRAVRWVRPAGGPATSSAVGTLTPAAPAIDPESGRVTGTLALTAPGQVALTFRYELAREPGMPFSACSSGGGCAAAGTACVADVGRCLPQDDAFAPGGDFVDPRKQAWTAAALPARPAHLKALAGARAVEGLLCHDPARPGDYLGTAFIPVGGGPGEEPADAGELACSAQPTSQAFPFLAVDRPFQAGQDGQEVFNLLAACVDELTQAPPAPGELFAAARCLSPARFFAALAQVGAPARASNRMLALLLRGWLRAHATVGRIASLEREHADALAQQGETGQTPPMADILDALDRGWDLLLDAEVRQRLLAVGSADVVEADYRDLRSPILYWSFNQQPVAGQSPDAVPDLSGNGHALLITGDRSVWNGNAARTCTTYPTCRHPSFGIERRESRNTTASVEGSIETETVCTGADETRRRQCRRVTTYVYDGGVTCPVRAAEIRAGYPSGVTATVTGTNRRVSGNRFSETCSIRLDNVPVYVQGTGPVCGAPTTSPCEGPSDASKDLLASLAGGAPVTCATADSARLTLEGDYTLFGDIFVVDVGPQQHLLRKADGSFEILARRVTNDGGTGADNVYVDVRSARGTTSYRIATQPTSYAFVHKNGQFRLYGVPPGSPDNAMIELAPVQTSGPSIPVGTHATGRLELACNRGLWIDDIVVFDRALEPADVQHLHRTRGRSTDLAFPLPPLADSDNAAWKVGLPVYILDAAARHLGLLEQSLEGAAGTLYASCVSGAGDDRAAHLRRVGVSLRRILAAEALARALATTLDLETVPWAARYRGALELVRGARARVGFMTRQIDRCENPLGIAETDLPMYYQSSPGDPIASFFGSSRYLIAEAETQTQLAASRLEQARGAWLEQRASRFQRKLNAAEHARRVADLKRTAEATLQQLCGTPSGSPVGSTPILDSVLGPNGIDYQRLRACFIDSTRTVCTAAPLGEVPADCVRGRIGEQVLSLQGAMLTTSSARNAWERAQLQYEEYGRRCYEKRGRLAEDQADLEAFLDEVNGWRNAKMAADMVAAAARAAQGCTSLADTVFSFGASCATSIIAGAADIASLGFQEKINDLEDAYRANRERRERDEIIRDCFFEAEQQKHTISAQVDILAEASHGILAAQLELQNLKGQLDFEAVQAQTALATEVALSVSAPQHHFWFDEKIAGYRYSFDWARRLTYLAMRSAEYESQTSLALRDRVLSARRPQDLEDVQRTLKGLSVPGQVGPNRVDYVPLVVSLRDQILRLVPEVDPATGQVRRTAVQVFQEYLRSNATVVYSKGKRYGRGIRFSLRPFGATTTSCAERLWRVSASVQMDEEPALGQDLLVYQSNTFGSQVCGGEGRLQVARTRPERNLLLPRPDGSPSLLPLGGQPSATTSMRVEALFNRTRRELLDVAPDAGNSGFAGRGLFSDYVLVIPDAAVRAGFDFTKMKDILLRLQLVGTAAGGDIDP